MASGDPDAEFTPFTLDHKPPALLSEKNQYAYLLLREAFRLASQKLKDIQPLFKGRGAVRGFFRT